MNNSKSFKIRTFYPISAKVLKETNHSLSTSMNNYLAQNLNLAELERKIENFIKSERFVGFFTKFNLKRPWSLYK